MSHITKVILRIIRERVHSRIRPEIGIEQCGFVQDTGTRNAIFMVRIISERAIEKHRDVCMCSIDYTKAFDRVQHHELLKMLMNLNPYGKDIHLIWNLYWDQSACIGIENEMSECTKIKRGVHQGCVLSYDLFTLYSEMILPETEHMKDFIIGANISNLRYADDTVLLAESEKELQDLLDKVAEESKKKDLMINCKKTECMVVSKRVSPACAPKTDKTIKQVQKFNFLGNLLTENGKCDEEIKKRIGMAKDAFHKLQKIVKNSKLSLDI